LPPVRNFYFKNKNYQASRENTPYKYKISLRNKLKYRYTRPSP
jgi:hypothetical protein